jgi:hypothetical protein
MTPSNHKEAEMMRRTLRVYLGIPEGEEIDDLELVRRSELKTKGIREGIALPAKKPFWKRLGL